MSDHGDMCRCDPQCIECWYEKKIKTIEADKADLVNRLAKLLITQTNLLNALRRIEEHCDDPAGVARVALFLVGGGR